MSTQAFDWSNEINNIITKSLVTTFGLDFLLLEDKKGGDVNTVHNVRQGIWATDEEKEKYQNKEQYNSHAYHTHENYIQKGRNDKILHQKGELKDYYRKDKNLELGANRDLDHVQSAYEIHHDAGRILADLDGSELANQDSNLSSTLSSINRTKKQHSVDDFINKLPQTILNREIELSKLDQKLKQMQQETPQQRHEYQKVQDQIRKKQQALDGLKQVDADAMKQVDQNSREIYDEQVNTAYYTSSKFFKSSLNSAMNTGFKMGMRESIGLVFAEVWFELRSQFPVLFKKYKNIEFKIFDFLNDLKETIINIFERVKLRFKDIFHGFKDGTISGVFSSITTKILNIFLTTTKFWGKIIRETWLNIVSIVKLTFFNPENLSTGELAKATFKILSVSIGIVTGMLVHENLIFLEAIPFLGNEIRTFLTALSTGVLTLALNYFIEQSPIMKKFWAYLDQFKTKYERVLDHFKEINIELDRYVLELAQLEFGINVDELTGFANELENANSELGRHIILKNEIDRRNIKLPFEMGNKESLSNWLMGLVEE